MNRLPGASKEALQKARDSALLAVEVYNKPAISFKSGAYITLMVIAWTALFHAIFFRRKKKPYNRKPNRRYVRVDGDYKHWELNECLKEYYGDDSMNPVRKNLEFFIPLRNKIEHRAFPELDPCIFGECQAMLLNFDEMLKQEFGSKHCIHQCLSFALQFYPSSENLAEAVRRNRDAKSAAEFVERYRSSITTEVFQSSQYSFKAFLIQVANHQSKDALAIQGAGARALLLEAVPPELTDYLSHKLTIPVYSIGAGLPCDGQLIICGDMLGLFQAFTPKFVKKYANVAEVIINAFKEYVADVKEEKFPEDKHVYHAIDSKEAFETLFKEFE